MMVMFRFSDTVDSVLIEFGIDGRTITYFQFQDFQHFDQCIMTDTLFAGQEFLVRKNKYRAAFESLERVIALCIPPNENRKIILDFDFTVYNGPINFRRRLHDIELIIFRGNVNPHVITQWHDGISEYYVPSIRIHVPRGEIMRGLGNLEVVRNAEKLAILDGYCDITDEQLANFRCDEIMISSVSLTLDGVRDAVRRAHEDDGEEPRLIRVQARRRFFREVMNDIIPPEHQDGWVLQNPNQPE